MYPFVFSFLKRSEPARPEITRAELDALRNRVDDMRRELSEAAASAAEAKKENALLRVEWSEILAKVTTWAARMSALARKRVNRSLDQATEDPPPELTLDQSTGPGGHQSLDKTELRRRVAERRRQA